MRSTYPKATNKRARDELCNIFQSKKKKASTKVAWRHKFVCLASKQQEKVSSTDCEKRNCGRQDLGKK